MKMIRSWRRLAATVLAAGSVAYSGQAANDSAPGKGEGRGLVQRIAAQLELTEDQQTQIKAIFKTEQDHLRSLLERLHDTRGDLREAIHAAGATEGSVRAAAAKVAAVEADLAVERLKLSGRIDPLLTDEQREKLAGLETHLEQVIDTLAARPGEAPAN